MADHRGFRDDNNNYAKLITHRGRSLLVFRNCSFPAMIGENGLTDCKIEGDRATPYGVLPLRRVFYRQERVRRPKTSLPCRKLTILDGWCDDTAAPQYNQLIHLPSAAHHEVMMREDTSYDIVAVLGWNDGPVRLGRGSAIFLHLPTPLGVTAGCIALAPRHLRRFLSMNPKGIVVKKVRLGCSLAFRP